MAMRKAKDVPPQELMQFVYQGYNGYTPEHRQELLDLMKLFIMVVQFDVTGPKT
jgi:hypothetical protein